MFSNKFSLFRTLKFKAALMFSALFVFFAATGFLIVYYFMYTNMLAIADGALNSMADDVVYEYFWGRSSVMGKRVPEESLPLEIRERVNAVFPDDRILMLFRPGKNMSQYFMVTVCGNQLYEIKYDPERALQRRRLVPSRNRREIFQTIDRKVYRVGKDNIYFRFLNPDGTPFLRSEIPGELENAVPRFSEDQNRESGAYFLTWKGFRFLHLRFFSGDVLEIGLNLRPFESKLEYYSWIFWTVFAVILAFSAFCGWFISRRLLAGVERVTDATHHILAGNFSHRVEVGNEGLEVEELVRMFNQMNSNTEKLMAELVMVTDNIAHDLRTPLTRVAGTVEVALSARKPDLSYRETCCTVAEECSRMIDMINTMLEISRLYSAPDTLKHDSFDLVFLLEEAHELLLPLAEEKEIDFRFHAAEPSVMFCGDKLKIQRMTANLLENALKFTPPKGSVELRLQKKDSFAEIIVSDTGCGISPEDQLHVFERFFRSDSSRSLPGNGLGLALVYSIVKAHGGTIELKSEPGKGTVFTVRFRIA